MVGVEDGMGNDPTMRVVQGVQHWLVVRTDRDGASPSEVADRLGAFLDFVFDADIQETFQTGEHEWRIGSARPCRILKGPSLEPLVLDAGTTIADSQRLDVAVTVSAQKPWWLVVEIWWRAPDREIRWPAARQGIFGGRDWTVSGADWALLESRVPVASSDPGAETWGESVSTSIQNTAAEAGQMVKAAGTRLAFAAVGVAAVAGAILLARRRRSG